MKELEDSSGSLEGRIHATRGYRELFPSEKSREQSVFNRRTNFRHVTSMENKEGRVDLIGKCSLFLADTHGGGAGHRANSSNPAEKAAPRH